MKAQHVTTGRDRDRAYSSIFTGIALMVLGVAVAGGVNVWFGVVVIVVGVLCIWSAKLRLRGEI